MLRPFGSIAEVFEVAGRGCFVLIPDSDIAPGLKLRIGDDAAVVSEGCDPIRTTVKGIELGHRAGGGFVGVLLGPEVRMSDARPGASLMKEDG